MSETTQHGRALDTAYPALGPACSEFDVVNISPSEGCSLAADPPQRYRVDRLNIEVRRYISIEESPISSRSIHIGEETNG